MSFYYHKRITIVPKLVHLNVSNRGWSVTFGSRRAHVTRDSHGHRSASVRLPGGFSWRHRSRRQ
ncbi:DUF4236 domain-containing protein [Streptomyces sp. A3M-1-3]|uniref:DUF4236 domain-containing protein n=1 Tax=Streptomyces sp. A3M-1-3 TaxID=2962044 RepID=UPI0020B6C982|nr:DUF4236 domain-containing protein [Streptomyces sp. A3M-1-3]MCP3820846.1 DUF4236 domain-containing protein [Streptomyces sp. A3M-1-3]